MEKKEKIYQYIKLYKNYKIEIIKEEFVVGISISSNKSKNYSKNFSLEEIKEINREFFYPFKDNCLLLCKFLVRLLKANLFKIIINNNTISLCLTCLKNDELLPITIIIPCHQENGINNNTLINLEENHLGNISTDNNNVIKNCNQNKIEEVNNIGSAPGPKIKKKKNDFEYKINLNIIKNSINESLIEIKIEEKNINDNHVICYYNYLDSDVFFSQSNPYYTLFDNSINDLYDDLNIIFYHKNYRFEYIKDSIKIFFKVFNFGNNSGEPYQEIHIIAYNRERNEELLSEKMETFLKRQREDNIIENQDYNKRNGTNEDNNN